MLRPTASLLPFVLLACGSFPTATNGPVQPKHASEEGEGLSERVRVDPVATAKVVRGINQFSIELYKHTPKEGNVVASPLSVAAALSVLELGTRGRSAQALQALLGTSNRERHKLGLQGLLQQLRGGGPAVKSDYEQQYPHELVVRSSLWVDKAFPLSSRYRKSIASSYQAVARQVDLRQPEAAAAHANQWASLATAGKIKSVADASTFHHTMRLLLLNAVYFQGSWSTPFAHIQPAPFHVEGRKKTSEVTMMSRFDHASSTQNKDVKILELPYLSTSRGVNLTMTVLLPRQRNGLAQLEDTLTMDRLQAWLAEMRGGAVDIKLPMWQTDSTLDFKAALSELGLGPLFGPEANLSGISKQEGLHLGAVIHRAYINVDDKGTEAAGVTAMGVPCSAPVGDGTFHADHPFLYLIRDKKSGAILFIGRVVDPR